MSFFSKNDHLLTSANANSEGVALFLILNRYFMFKFEIDIIALSQSTRYQACPPFFTFLTTPSDYCHEAESIKIQQSPKSKSCI